MHIFGEGMKGIVSPENVCVSCGELTFSVPTEKVSVSTENLDEGTHYPLIIYPTKYRFP